MPQSSITSFLKIAAIASLLGALTTALLIFLPNPAANANDPESTALLAHNSLYLSRLWILFLHPQFNLVASVGIAYLLVRKHPAQIIIGSLFLILWAFSEMSQQALLIDALNQMWRPGYLSAGDEVTKNAYLTLTQAANGLSDSKYFLVLYGFGLGSLLFGWAFIYSSGLGRWLGISLLFIGLLSLSSFARYYLGWSFLNPFANFSYQYIYPYLQPLVRIGLAIWIWRQLK